MNEKDICRIAVRIPFAEDYVTLLGCAIYCFNYYESCIVDILSILDKGFRQKYYRELSLTSGNLNKKFAKIQNAQIATIPGLDRCFSDFSEIIEERNRLIHSHPVTDVVENQILNYQADIKKSVHDFKWGREQIRDFTMCVDECLIRASDFKVLRMSC